jgi:glycerol-3-phosphate dehydrogenase
VTRTHEDAGPLAPLSDQAAMTDLSPRRRAWSVGSMASKCFDVVVIGGGITGVGAALDASSRGWSVALVEARDYGAGASSKSSKLIHGGLRYLEMLEFGLVREALRERALLMTKLAPHLVHPVPFIWPLTHRFWERAYVGAGLLLYDRIGGAKVVPAARHLSRRATLRLARGLRPDALIGAVQFYDAQTDDARMVVAVARTAAGLGAAMATNMRADGLLMRAGRVIGVQAYDVLRSVPVSIRARHVVSAAGAWAEDLQHMAVGRSSTLRVRPSKGIHVVVPRSRIEMSTGLITRTEKSVLFVIPWLGDWLIGDTDTDWEYDKAHPAASGADIDYLLAKVNSMLRVPLERADIVGVFAGLRPLVATSADKDSTRLSREHVITSPLPGFTTIAGGKFTTYRVMARDLMDAVAADLASKAASRTSAMPILGAEGYPELLAQVPSLARDWKLPENQVRRLLSRYGAAAVEVADLMAASPELRAQLPGSGVDEGYLAAEVVYACTSEGALRLPDVMERRTRMAIKSRDHGMAAAPHVAQLMAAVLGWDQQRVKQEVDYYERSAAADEAAQAERTDAAAYAARLAAPEIASFYR